MKDMNLNNSLPVAIIGAGPVGLAAAANLHIRGENFIIFEAGSQVADSVRQWQHVSMFSPWRFNIDKASETILSRYNWKSPEKGQIPTGKELLERYILPLSETEEIGPFIKLNSNVVSVSRKRINKLKNFSRDHAPFVLRLETPNGKEVIEARAVIDASGTWKNPNPAGADGLPAIGEDQVREHIEYGIPDILGTKSNRYLNKDVAVIGGGHSAINALLELADLNDGSNDVSLHWILTKRSIEAAYGGLQDDELPGRGKVGLRVKEIVESGTVMVHTPFFVEKMSQVDGKVLIEGETSDKNNKFYVDEIIVATGLKPDLEILREIRISLDQGTESPIGLAPFIDPNVHSCGSVKPHGESELRHPEKDFYIVGMKSYGRAPTFLLATGYEQVRSVVAGLSGDWEAAAKVQLKLPETGVCGVPQPVDPNSLNDKSSRSVESSCC